MNDKLAYLGRASERNFVYVSMCGERSTRRFTVARNDVDDAVGEAGFCNELAQPQRRERRLLGGFQHDGAARSKRWAEFPCSHQ